LAGDRERDLLGGMNTTPIRIELTSEERTELEKRARGQRVAHRDAVRARIILLIGEGRPLSEVARRVGRQRTVVRKWGERFVKKRMAGLRDKPGRGRVPVFSPGDRRAFGEAGLRAP
jgi:hypothetical protein